VPANHLAYSIADYRQGIFGEQQPVDGPYFSLANQSMDGYGHTTRNKSNRNAQAIMISHNLSSILLKLEAGTIPSFLCRKIGAFVSKCTSC